MNFTEEELNQFQTLEDLEKEIFTPKQIEEMNKRALMRSQARENSTILLLIMSHKIAHNFG